MLRRNFLIGAGAFALAPNTLLAQEVKPLVWTSGGTDPSGWSHDDALAAFVRKGILPDEARREFSLLANNGPNGRGYAYDPIQQGQVFEAMCFGGVKTPKKRVHDKVIANPDSWTTSSVREMRTWMWEGKGPDGKRMTVGYAVPLVCGNSSAIRYRNGAPICVPIPRGAQTI